MISNCPACGAPLGNSTTVCPFCNYALNSQPEKPASDALYNPPIESVPEPEPVEVIEPAPQPQAMPDPEPEPVYQPQAPSPVADVAEAGRKIRKTGGKIAIGIVIAVVVVICLVCGALAYGVYWFFTQDFSALPPALAQLPTLAGWLA